MRPAPPPPLVLASASPRRARLLELLGLSFQVAPPHIEEGGRDAEGPELQALRLSREKASQVARLYPEALVLAGDTLVVLRGEVLGKPRDPQEAVRTLLRLAGRTHLVVSALALAPPGAPLVAGRETTRVTFRAFGEEEARRYVATGEPMDKAGAYGIQGLGAALVRRIQGDYTAVVGFPVPLFLELLEEAGWRYDFGGIVSREGGAP